MKVFLVSWSFVVNFEQVIAGWVKTLENQIQKQTGDMKCIAGNQPD